MKEAILALLSKHPEGLTITSIAEKLGIHRHTATKYIQLLVKSGEVSERNVGMAKLCFLNKYKHEHDIAFISESGQAKIFILALLFLSIPMLIIAESFDANITGSFIDSNFPHLTTTLESFVENSTDLPLQTQPLTIEEAVENSTVNSTEIEQSVNEVIEISPSIGMEDQTRPAILLDVPTKVNRGEEFEATLSINHPSSKKLVKVSWQLPPGFLIVEGEREMRCFVNECVSKLKLKAQSDLGLQEIKVKISYE